MSPQTSLAIHRIIREHRAALLFAVAAVLVVFSPYLLFPLVADSYQGINVGDFGADEFHYLAYGKELLEGHALGNPFLRDGKAWLNPQHLYAPYLVLPLTWVGLSDVPIVAVSRVFGFAGVFVLVLLVYAWVLQLSGDKRLSLVSALFVVLGYNLLTDYLFIHHVNFYARPIVPLTSALVFFLYLNVLTKSLSADARAYAIAAGVVFGLSFYTYFYAWTFIVVLNVILAILYFIRGEPSLGKKILRILALGFALGAVEVALLYLFSQTDMGRQILLFQGGAETRVFTVVKQSWLALFFFCVFLYSNPREKHWPLLLALLLAGIVAINQGVISGREFQRFHYFWHFILPTVTVVGLYLAWTVIRSAHLKRALWYALMFIVFAHGAIQSYLGLLSALPLKNHLQYYAPLIERLKADNTPSVILAANNLPELLFVTYTDHDIFFHHHAGAYNTDARTIEDALYVYAYLDARSRDDFLRVADAKSPRDTEPSGIYRELKKYYTSPAVIGSAALTAEEFRAHMEQGYSAVRESPDAVLNILKRHRVGYVVWDETLEPEWDISAIGGLEKLQSSGPVHLYAVRS